MLTRCPNCDTQFRVTSLQIKARAGMVRCGACTAIFNALETLVDEPIEAPPTERASDPGFIDAEPPHESLLGTEGMRPDTEYEPLPDHELDMVAELSGDARRENEIAVVDEDEVEDRVEDESDFDFVNYSADAETESVADVEAETTTGNQSGTDADVNAETKTESSPDLADYMAAPFAVAPSALMAQRWPWIAGSTVAAFLLLLQLAYYYRVDLAVTFPNLRPAMLTACKTLHCEIPRPRNIETVGIETSDLRPDPQQPGRLTLKALLRNQAGYAQEWPLLELTLTDVTDQKLVVKDFAASDYLPKGSNGAEKIKQEIANGFPAKGEVNVSLPLDVVGLPAAGYRLYVFYP